MNYHQFSVPDFLADDYFLEWVLRPDVANDVFWLNWLQGHPDKKEEVAEARRLILLLRFPDRPIADERIAGMLQAIHAAADQAESRPAGNRRPPAPRQRVAAYFWRQLTYVGAVALVLCGLFAAHFLYRGAGTPSRLEALARQAILPEHAAETQLLLTGARTVVLSPKVSSLSYQGNGRIRIASQEAVEAENPGGFNVLVVPPGKRSVLALDDGTKVWVNSGSRLVYPVSFTGNERRVYLDGEAYFEVQHNAQKPFLVETQQMDVQVLGTSFNVTAYPGEQTSSAVLVNGSIGLIANKTTLFGKISRQLTPNQQAVYHQREQQLQVREVQVEDYISWKEGYLLAREMPLRTILARLERYYNRRITLRDVRQEQQTFTGKLDLKQDITEVMDLLATTTELDYLLSERSTAPEHPLE
ncbi:FecR family protein [Hymenobacter roseosalivarius DSM 11622]|uniref:FecR family protein n=1 Tax=Hymenobacter roseosalivarius DSM 11622 TaxID=645990 RepID=A0A1W1UGD7_9BACT|nr:FecR domain-containing protein [Hymenobacter roseosalivarius]SMB80147.1 FecR family protein [Hymenobacter roseosalivarius DSM 11622]